MSRRVFGAEYKHEDQVYYGSYILAPRTIREMIAYMIAVT